MFSGIFRMIIFSSVIAGGAFASNYPDDYTHQTAHLINFVDKQGSKPAFIANLTSGIMSQVVLGYKYTGRLSKYYPASVDAVVIGKCESFPGEVVTKLSVVKIGREWNNKGYLSAPQSLYSFFGSCGPSPKMELSVAFSDGHGNWDSRDGENYSLRLNDFYGPAAVDYKSHESGPYGGAEPNQKIWNFLIQAL